MLIVFFHSGVATEYILDLLIYTYDRLRLGDDNFYLISCWKIASYIIRVTFTRPSSKVFGSVVRKLRIGFYIGWSSKENLALLLYARRHRVSHSGVRLAIFILLYSRGKQQNSSSELYWTGPLFLSFWFTFVIPLMSQVQAGISRKTQMYINSLWITLDKSQSTSSDRFRNSTARSSRYIIPEIHAR